MAWDIDQLWSPRLLRSSRPWRDWEDMEHFFEPGWPFRRTWHRMPEDVSWSPPLDIYEKEDSFTVRVEIPGVKMDDIDISVTGDTLTVRGERKVPEGVKDEEYQRCEVCYGPFTRSVSMPATVDADKVEAKYTDGVLEIRIPKAKEAKPKKIPIKTGK